MIPASLIHFLSALGNSVLNSFWQMGLLWLIIIMISHFKKKISPGQLSLLSFLAIMTGFALFLLTFAISFYTPQTGTGFFAIPGNAGIAEKVMSYAAGIYLLLLVIPIARFLAGYKNVRQLKRNGLQRVPGRYKLFVLDMAGYLGIKKRVSVWISEMVETPLTMGFLRPVILLPVAVVNNLSPAQVEAILLHELTHIKKNDYILNLIVQMVLTFLYFNPFAKALFTIYNLEREKAADGGVLQFQYDGHMYASTLLHLAQQRVYSNNGFAIKASGHKSHLYNRVQWIMGVNERPSVSVKKLVTSATMILLLTVFLPAVKNSGIQRSTGFQANEIARRFDPKLTYTSDPDKNDYLIEKIPAITSEKQTQQNTVFLKEVRNPETGSVEIIKPAAQDIPTSYVLVANPEVTAPILTAEQEQNVQISIAAAKRLFAENNWRHIEMKLAETVTTEQKLLLKEAFKSMINATDWDRQADVLRLAYNDIDWVKAKNNFNLEMGYIKLDSVYNHYSSALEKYNAVKKEIAEDKLMELNRKIAETQIILHKADSLRRKRIVEL